MTEQAVSASRPTPFQGRLPTLWSSGLISLGTFGLLLAPIGAYWDISWHVDLGRDTFWSPPHLVIYGGMLITFLTVGLGLLLAWRYRRAGVPDESNALMSFLGLRISPGLFITGIGALVVFVAGPVDELWHRLFGLDITIWSPPHLMLILGFAMAALGLLTTVAGELNRSRPERLRAASGGLAGMEPREIAMLLLGVALLAPLVVALGEYEFAVPQFWIGFYPPLLAAVAVFAATVVRQALGRYFAGSLMVTVYTLLRLIIAAFVYAVGREAQATIPAILVPTVAFEAVLWWRRDERPAVLALASAVFVAVLFAVQTPYLTWFDGIRWTARIMPFAIPASLVLTLLAALLGQVVGRALRPAARSRAASS